MSISHNIVQGPPLLPWQVLSEAYNSAGGRLMVFDYDGTLTPIVNDPKDAIPSDLLLRSLRTLGNNESNIVYIASGRSADFLDQYFGSIKGIGLSAEHGCFLKPPGQNVWQSMIQDIDMSWKVQIKSMFDRLVERVPKSRVELKEIAIVWHYRDVKDHEMCLEIAREAKIQFEASLNNEQDVEVIFGKANLEARPRSINKGNTVARLLLETLGRQHNGTFVMCAGDDTTDEDMFRAILSADPMPEHTFTCLINELDRPSMAHYRLESPQDLIEYLGRLANIDRMV